MRIEIFEYKLQVKNGNRGTTYTPASKFSVMLIKGSNSECLYTTSQYDPRWCSVDTDRVKHVKKAQEKATSIGNVIGCKVILKPTTIPAEVESLKKQIKELKRKLKKLAKGN